MGKGAGDNAVEPVPEEGRGLAAELLSEESFREKGVPRDSERFFHLVVVALVIFFIDQKNLLEEALLFDLLREPAGG